MNITLKQLKSFKACVDGITWFKSQKEREAKKVLRKLLKEDKFPYAMWYVLRLFTQSQAVLLSIFCAERCISIFEKQFPNDTRPRAAINAAIRWLISPSSETRTAAANAAYVAANAAAYAAAYAAEAAAYAAEAAANATAYAAYAANAAANAASDAAYAASDAAYAAANAASDATKITEQVVIIERAIEILGL